MYKMLNLRKQIEVSAILLLLLHIASPKPAKSNARPVHEIVNEQSRIDEKRNPGILPYGNPLAGNLQQNIRLHAQNQQAMFNAERVRQHRAQLQRWSKQPQQIDSYMKAYQESQENHQLALEQQQANVQTPKRVNNKQEKRVKLQQGPDPIAKTDHKEKSRNHRSYGSVQNQQYLMPKRHQSVYISQASAYDQGVTIKPNGNVGIKQFNEKEEASKLYTEVMPSKTQYIYPKQYSQMQSYESAQDIKALNSLLTRTPRDQLLELNALIQSDKQTAGEKDPLETPIDLFFYVKDQPTLPERYEESYNQDPQNYASGYLANTGMKDHTPITEEIDDVEAPRMNSMQVLPTHIPEDETTTTKSNNYYKVEVASQIISGGHNPKVIHPEYYEKDVYETIKYEQPGYYVQDPKDDSKQYYHHNSQQGVQHLTSDGVGVSAYGDDNLHYAANYEFGYRVRDHHTGNDFGHHETKKDGNTNGNYHVLLPDGRMQRVKYYAGPDGYHADITYDHVH